MIHASRLLFTACLALSPMASRAEEPVHLILDTDAGADSEVVGEDGEVKRRGMKVERAEAGLAALEAGGSDMAISKVIRCRVRYFTDGAVIGGRSYVDEVFRECREKFGERRKSGARKPRGALGQLAGTLWAARDLRVGRG